MVKPRQIFSYRLCNQTIAIYERLATEKAAEAHYPDVYSKQCKWLERDFEVFTIKPL